MGNEVVTNKQKSWLNHQKCEGDRMTVEPAWGWVPAVSGVFCLVSQVFLASHLSDVRRLQMSLKQQLDCSVDQLVLFLWLHNKNTAQWHGPGLWHARGELSIYTGKHLKMKYCQKCGSACWSCSTCAKETRITLVWTSEGLCFLISWTTS